VDIAVGCDLTNERDTSGGDGQQVERGIETRGQLLELDSPAMLIWCQAAQATLNVLGLAVDPMVQTRKGWFLSSFLPRSGWDHPYDERREQAPQVVGLLPPSSSG
jgi:hypothetical protein